MNPDDDQAANTVLKDEDESTPNPQSMAAQPAHLPQHLQQTQQTQSASPSADTVLGQNHTRNYQACILCRKRKVKCDLGPVDNPHDPPCQRCRREVKECYFSSTRRKRKSGEEAIDDGDSDEFEVAYEARNSRKRTKSDSRDNRPPIGLLEHTGVGSRSTLSSVTEDWTHPPLTPGGGIGQSAPLRRPDQRSSTSDEEDQALSNGTAAILQRKEVFSGHDALHLLAEVAEQNGKDSKRRRTLSSSNVPGPQFLGEGRLQSSYAGRGGHTIGNAGTSSSALPGRQSRLRTSITTSDIPSPPGSRFEGMPGLEDAVKAWSKLRFVRARWFTTYEGIEYIDYFYRYLYPLTPIILPDFQMPATHSHLLRNEPMLTVTILAIASRYKRLRGHGASTRAFAIHEKLWTYLQNMIDRMNWGQERFSTDSAGVLPRIASAPGAQRGLRTVGSIESLLLLTEWHPRALHFPPGDDNDELMIGEEQSTAGVAEASLTVADELVIEAGETKIEGWLEPCWKSDRLCWSLLGNALTLAYELGLMNTSTQEESSGRRRTDNVRRLLYIYMTQTSGRLSLPSMIAEERWSKLFDEDSIATAIQFVDISQTPQSADLVWTDSKDAVQLVSLHFWYRIAHMFYIGNKELFPSRDFTTKLVKTGEYSQVLDRLAVTHLAWRKDFDQCKIVPSYMRFILDIEYEYMRVYGNCLALQAVVDRCANMSPRTRNNIIHPSTLSKCFDGDRRYITDIVRSSQRLLRCIVEGLLPDEYLKHAPVRTYFRVISVSMILLKTFALGATEDDMAVSLSLLDQAAHALHVCIVDDVHIGSRFAELLSVLAQRVRSRIVRVSRGGRSSTASRANSQSPPTDGSRRGRGTSTRRQGSSSGSISDRRGSSRPAPLQDTWQPQPQTQAQTQPLNHQQWAMNYDGIPQAHMYQPSPRAANAFMQQSSSFLPSTYGPGQMFSHPMRGVSPSLPYDPFSPGVNIMPPPLPEGYTGYGQPGSSYQGDDSGYPDDMTDLFNIEGFDNQGIWCALPLDQILSSGPVPVTHTGFGPGIGGQDMLNVLLGDDLDGQNGPRSAGPR